MSLRGLRRVGSSRCRWIQHRKTFGNQFLCLIVARLQIDAVEHDRDYSLAMTRCCHGNGKTCLRDITGLQPVAALDVAEQMIMRSHDDGFVAGIRSERSLAGGSVTEGIGMFQEQLAAKK